MPRGRQALGIGRALSGARRRDDHRGGPRGGAIPNHIEI